MHVVAKFNRNIKSKHDFSKLYLTFVRGIYMKPKKDIHILDWSAITRPIQRGKTCDSVKTKKNKGILFEDLVEELLLVMFPNEVWTRTQESYDRKRDFYYPSETYLPEQKWVECKNYNSNVSINTISPTLVMGAIDNIECIYFFSYSPLNDNAIEGLLRYSESANKTIKIFDGNLLEALICRYHNKSNISRFFPNTDFIKAIDKLGQKPVRVIRTLKDMKGNVISPTHLFELGERFYISIIVQNQTSEYIDYTLKFNYNNSECLLCNTHTFNNGLPFGAIKEHSILCTTTKANNISYSISVAGKNSKTKKVKPLNKKGVIKILDEQYLFWSGENAMKVYDNCINHIINYKMDPLFITAGSGTGKSTLLNILMQNETLHKKYTIINLDLNLTRNYCVRNLFCQIFGVYSIYETPDEQSKEDKEALSLLVNGYAQGASMIAETIMQFYNVNQPFLFVIDDIQKINRSYIDLLCELNLQSEKNDMPIYYISTLNEDILSINDLLIRLNWDLNNKRCKYSIENLSKFDKNDIISFLKHKFGLFNIEDYFDGFEKTISPLELYSFSTDLKNNHIISRIPKTSTYQIVDHYKFAENLDKILFSNISIKTICNSIDNGDIPEYLLKYLYVCGEIGEVIKKKYITSINKLITLGILKEYNGKIIFFHDKIKKCIGEKLTYTEEDYADIFYDKNTDIVSKAICAINQINRIKNAAEFLENFFESKCEIKKVSQRYELCWLIFENFQKLIESEIITKALNFVRLNFDLINKEQDYGTYFEFLRHIVNSAQNINWDVNKECVENMLYFIKKFFDRTLSTHNEQILYDYYIVFKDIILKLKHISEERRNYWLSHYSNRAAIALDRESFPLGKESKLISTLYQESEYYCKKAGNPEELLLQIIVDSFNRYYVYRHSLTHEIACSSYTNLTNLKRVKINRTTCLDYHKILFEYLKIKLNKNFVECSSIDLSKIKNNAKEIRLESTSRFYTLKLYMLEIYLLIDLNRYSEAADLLSEAFEFVYQNGLRQYIYKLTYIRANLLAFDKDKNSREEINAQSILALEQFIDSHCDALSALQREIFIVIRLIALIDNFEQEVLNDIINRTTNTYTVDLLKNICYLDEDKLSSYSDLFKMDSYFTFNGVSFPTI